MYCLKAAYGADAGGSYTVNEGEPLVLSATNSVGPPGSNLNYAWDLDGDGVFNDGFGPIVTNTWSLHGVYVVSVMVSDASLGYSDVAQASVAVLDVAPTARLGGPTNLNQGDTGVFFATNSTAGPDAIVKYEWDWNYDGVSFRGIAGSAVQTNAWPDWGTNTVALRITDQDGMTGFATMTVNVLYVDPCLNDTQPPELDCPALVQVEQESPDGASVQTVTNTIASLLTLVDNCDPSPRLWFGDYPSVFPPGVAEISVNAQDASGNRSVDRVMVAVADTTPPVLTYPPAITVEQASPSGTFVVISNMFAGNGTNLFSIGPATFMAMDPCVACPKVQVSASEVGYPPGRTPVTFVASDASGNCSTGVIMVIVRDTIPPVITLSSPTNGTVLSNPAALPVCYTVSDAADTNPTVMVRFDGQLIVPPIPPASLTVGSHRLEVIARDRAGNVSTVAATVTVTQSRCRVVAWGDDTWGQTTVPANLLFASAVAGGARHSLAITATGWVSAWGDGSSGQTEVPAGLSNVLAVAAGAAHNLALDIEGKVTAWGDNSFGQTSVPSVAAGACALAAGSAHSLGLLASGAVIAWGANPLGQSAVPTNLPPIQSIAAGSDYSVALTTSGSVIAWGDNSYGQTNVPPELTGVMAIAAGDNHTLALLSTGAVVGWGQNDSGQTNVPSGLSNVVAIAAGGAHSLALKNDGTVVAWGALASVPPWLSNVVAIAAGGGHNLALVGGPLPSVPVDSDGDGLPDDWELAHGLNPNDGSDAALDSDHDGMSNLQEYLAGTDPQDAQSVLRAEMPNDGTRRVQFEAVAGHDYMVEYRESLTDGAWQALTNVPAQDWPAARQVTVLDLAPRATCYYRIATQQTVRACIGPQGEVCLQFTALAGQSYTIQYRDSAGSAWSTLTTVAAVPAPLARLVTVSDPAATGCRLYRLTTP